MKEFGEAKKILGVKIMRETSKGVFYLSQRRYFEKMLQHFSTDCTKVVSMLLGSYFDVHHGVFEITHWSSCEHGK